MEFGGLTARDLPAPATLAADAADFAVPVFGLVAQPRLQFAGHGTSRVDRQVQSISASYSYLADPVHPDAESNFVENIDEVRGWMRKADDDDQPDWFKDAVARARYPMLWEAVLTAIDAEDLHPLAEHLAEHVNHLLDNTMPHRLQRGADDVPHLDHGVRASHAQPATLTISGRRVPGLTIDTDPDVIGWAAQDHDAIVVIGLPREHATHLDRAVERLD